MKLEAEEFRSHVKKMMEGGNKKQLEMWVNHGLLIYVNHEQLMEIWDEEYEDDFRAM